MFKTIIGLEIHVQLNTKSKMFCGCDNPARQSFASGDVGGNAEGREPNTAVCPVCMGYPGTLPVANIEAIKKTIKTGIALGCEIPVEAKFDRKHYFYPDLPKNFQISQYDKPFARHGVLKIKNQKSKIKNIRINRVHLEEDAGKLIHPRNAGYTIVDMNRCGTPLMEVVTEPDIDSPELAKILLKELRLIIRYIGVSDADMEKGHLRCDANISVRKSSLRHSELVSESDKILNQVQDDKAESTPIIEIKNMNSFRAVEAALAFEEKRLRDNFDELKKEKGKKTRAWSEEEKSTKPMRSKEEASDYRYFPEPDVAPVRISNNKSKISNGCEINLNEIKKEIPELPENRRKRYQKLGLSEKAVEAIIAKKAYADYFDAVVKLAAEPHKIYDLMINEKCGTKIKAENLAEAAKLVRAGKISNKILKEILPQMAISGKSADEILAEKGIRQLSDEGELKKIIKKIIKQNNQAVESYKKGKTEALGFLVGQVMKETRGQANPPITNKILKNLLK